MNGLKTAIGAVLVGFSTLIATEGAQASGVDYLLSFRSTEGGDVLGIVRGLEEGSNTVNTVEILANSLGYGIGSYTHNDSRFGTNARIVTAGIITDWTFVSFGNANTAPDVTDSGLMLMLDYAGLGSVVGLTNSDNSISPTFGAPEFTTVPAPLPAALLGSALFGLALVRRRRAA